MPNSQEGKIGTATSTILLRNIKKPLRCCRISIAGKGDFIRIFPSVKRICVLHLKSPRQEFYPLFSSWRLVAVADVYLFNGL
jgi:hypothetical protein